MRNDVHWATAWVKCLALCVSSQSGLLAIAERSTGTASCRIRFRLEQKVFLHFIADHFGQHQFADLGGAERERSLVESPGRRDSSSQDIRVEEQADSALPAHFQRWDGAERHELRGSFRNAEQRRDCGLQGAWRADLSASGGLS